MLGIGRLFRRSKQDADEKAPKSWEEVAAGPPPDRENTHEPLIVSPTHAKDIMLDDPDPPAENVVNIVNYLALNDVSNLSPKPTVPGKRKRQDTDIVDGSSKKRAAKGSGIKDTNDEYATTSNNGDTRRQGRSNPTSFKVVEAAPGKLPRPKKEPQKRHIANIHPAVQSSHDMWSPPPTPKQQVEKAAPPPTTPTRNPPSSEATPRPRGRPRRVELSATEKTTLTKKGQRKNAQTMTAKPGHEERPEGYMDPESKSRELYEVSIENSPQKGGPKTGKKASRTNAQLYNKRRTAGPKSTRSVASANGQTDLILNANIDLTKKPERDAQRAAKQSRNRELPSEALATKSDRTVARKAQVTKNPARARAQRASQTIQDHIVGEEHDEREQDESEREKRTESVEAIDRDGQMSDYLDERERGGTEVEEEESVSESSTEGVENEEEAEEHEAMELFGKDLAWKTILEGAQSVCGSKLPLNRMPKVLTKTIEDLIHDVKEAREVYEQLLPFKGIEHDSVIGLNNNLGKCLDAIDLRIRELSEQRAAKKGAEMIRDIYARAIPAMVFLLQSALTTREYHSDEPCDLTTLNGLVEGLEEITRLQKMAMELCEKAGTWKAKPVPTSRPIIWPTTRKMFPNLKLMRSAFSKHLLEQKRRRKLKENAFITAQKQENLLRSSQQASQESERINERRNRRLKESLAEEAQKRRNAHTSYRQVIANEQAKIQSQQVSGRIEPSNHWTEDEDIELYIQLEKGYDPGLTSTSLEVTLGLRGLR